ncbi:segregation and condensation protein A [Maritalea mediterranea]|uniref:Segregation and condensation protein A n=1 Tax=Maritalea mediterranea TaxID=2909667 RepID=A0ABS9E664_9HYPH|nr:ScpA family protein [Maritalea mediterranea]MCF4098278.1 segregation/condensation protein A [Maritalea mediterranea]
MCPNMPMQDEEFTQQPEPRHSVMYVDVKGYEGPLDLLLDLARKQKVDLAHISVLSLAEQYLGFIETLKERRIEVAADYLVMAAWLAYLKSRLMVPHDDEDEEPSGEEMAALLQFRLKRLEAMRDAAGKLVSRPRLGREIHHRGDPETIITTKTNQWQATYYDLLRAYVIQREKSFPQDYAVKQRTVWSLSEAEEILERLIGQSLDWAPLHAYLADYLASDEERVTALASSFTASLEMVRQGQIEMRQSSPFSPLMVRRRAAKTPDDN